ncbi:MULTISPECIES: polysaccharide lyase [unclassified Leptolyngbya]|uniref:polysaccharide lyase n=1 Tax=unclassified Leptolyngbya TaxID=2650499 RepID=UPI00168867A0|nr:MULTISPECIES: hypothetical protein [unclassified Leptolyngbya]MBD1911308.1 hypothetical protein [Leptolyngbya sp. FACHB-8]MBD2156674.1 hypothetical protein [Leptolyngbya sp. FACHB-16]
MPETSVNDGFAGVLENASRLPHLEQLRVQKLFLSKKVGRISRCLIGMTLIVLPLSGCTFFKVPLTLAEESTDVAGGRDRTTTLWRGDLVNPNSLEAWGLQPQGSWGLENLEVMADPDGRFGQVIRVHYPAGSASPAATRQDGAPSGGAQFYANLGIAPQNRLRLSYYVRFSENFDFVKGGKLPGLFGGEGASGGDNPDGTDGFSTRLMWRRQGEGEVYAYLPTSRDYGTSIGRGSWRFRPGVWHRIEQEVTLNQPNAANGQIRVWFDGALVLNQGGLRFRTVDRLQINGLFFSTFFGGNDSSWATPQDVYIDFADFSVSAGNQAQ